jgi:ATP-binding cassette subfamily B multidrug efflux pump
VLAVLLMMVVNAWVQVLTPELLGQAVDCYLTPAVTQEIGYGAAAQVMPAAGAGDHVGSAQACWFGEVPAGSPRRITWPA